jgi:hypothetical protein
VAGAARVYIADVWNDIAQVIDQGSGMLVEFLRNGVGNLLQEFGHDLDGADPISMFWSIVRCKDIGIRSVRVPLCRSPPVTNAWSTEYGPESNRLLFTLSSLTTSDTNEAQRL